ncbi:MAG: hypothetical protein ABDI19_10240 [Armatimonadota bacterium]
MNGRGVVVRAQWACGCARGVRGLGVWSLALVLGLQVALAQGRPDIVWMRGGHGGYVYSVAFSPDGQLLASGSEDRIIRLWRVADGQLLRTLTGHTHIVYSVAFSPDGQLIASASGSRDRTIKLWQVSTGQLLRTYDEETGIGVPSVQFSPNGAYFAYGRLDATLVLARNPFWIPGDVDGNGCVNNADLWRVLSAFGCQSNCGVEDLNGDGVVDDADLLQVLFNFGSEC